jgi:hypothetical protein
MFFKLADFMQDYQKRMYYGSLQAMFKAFSQKNKEMFPEMWAFIQGKTKMD